MLKDLPPGDDIESKMVHNHHQKNFSLESKGYKSCSLEYLAVYPRDEFVLVFLSMHLATLRFTRFLGLSHLRVHELRNIFVFLCLGSIGCCFA